jgi:hypothetical protein
LSKLFKKNLKHKQKLSKKAHTILQWSLAPVLVKL